MKSRRRGVALVGAVAIMMIAALATGTLYMLAQDELLRTRSFLEATRARQAARTGIAQMLASVDLHDGTPAANLSGDINGVHFHCDAEPAAGEDYRKLDPRLSGPLWRLSCVAGRVPDATEARAPITLRTTALVDPTANPPAIRIWVAETQGKVDTR